MHPISRYPIRAPLLFLLAPFGAFVFSIVAIDPAPQFQKSLATITIQSPSKVPPADLELNIIATNKVAPATAPEARTEAFWLSRSPKEAKIETAGWISPVVAGDIIFLNYGPDNQRKLEVVTVQEEEDITTKIDTNFFSEPHYILICKDVRKKDKTLIKLTIDAVGRNVTAMETISKTL